MTFRLPSVRWDEIVTGAAREGRTPSGHLRYMIERYLDGAAGTDLRRISDERVRRLVSGTGVIVDD